MRRLVAFSLVLAAILAVMSVGPASAGTRQDVTITVTELFASDPDEFTSSIPGCTEGLVYTGGKVVFTPAPGIFAGYKLFDCDGGGETGFLVRLNALFGPDGSVGTWSIVDAWGDLAGLSGSGKLTGDPIEGGIIDNYVGTLTF